MDKKQQEQTEKQEQGSVSDLFNDLKQEIQKKLLDTQVHLENMYREHSGLEIYDVLSDK